VRTVLIIGATGIFGKRLARHLLSFEGIELIVSSRSREKAAALVEELGQNLNKDKTAPKITGIALDHNFEFENILRELKPFIVVDCSGPFQGVGFDTAKTALSCGAHFIDIADARDYLKNFKASLSNLAGKSAKVALGGASSTPTLSTAVVEDITLGWRRVDTIDICISPAGKSEVGQALISAIVSYAGKKIPVWRDGQLSTTLGWGNSWVVTIPELGRRRVAAADTLDAENLGQKFNVASSVTFSAGLESSIEQWGLQFLARLRKIGVLKNLTPLIPLLLAARKITRFTCSDRGGMVVDILGLNAKGTLTKTRWSLLAEQDHGPFVPILPAAAAVKLLLAKKLKPGARLAFNSLSLADIEVEMAPYAITTKVETETFKQGAFLAHLGKEKTEKLPAAVKAFHLPQSAPVWVGEADVVANTKFIPTLMAKIMGFPASGKKIELTVTVERHCDLERPQQLKETWTRNFAGRAFSSTLEARKDGTFSEAFGLISFKIGLDANEDGLTMPVVGWSFLGIPLPKFLAPHSQAREFEDALGRFNFDVKLTLPLLGQFAHYKGWLTPSYSNVPRHPAANR